MEPHDGDLCLIDIGCELGGYVSDITHTFPISDRFIDPQHELYAPMVAVQEAILTKAHPGVPYNTPHGVITRVLVQGTLDTGLLDADKVGTLDDVIVGSQYHRFYIHRTGR